MPPGHATGGATRACHGVQGYGSRLAGTATPVIHAQRQKGADLPGAVRHGPQQHVEELHALGVAADAADLQRQPPKHVQPIRHASDLRDLRLLSPPVEIRDGDARGKRSLRETGTTTYSHPAGSLAVPPGYNCIQQLPSENENAHVRLSCSLEARRVTALNTICCIRLVAAAGRT